MDGSRLYWTKHRRAAGLLVLCAPLLAALGVWQLERAEGTERTAATAQARSRLAPLNNDAFTAPGDPLLLYRRARVTGRFEAGDALVLDGRKRGGRPGYHQLAPLHLDGTEARLLVNRGWSPEPATAALPAGRVEIEGLLVRPALPAIRLGGGASFAPGRPWPYVDPERFGNTRGYPVYPLILVAEPALAEEALAAAIGRKSRWGMHIGYAVHWFVFAALSLWLAFRLVRPRREAS